MFVYQFSSNITHFRDSVNLNPIKNKGISLSQFPYVNKLFGKFCFHIWQPNAFPVPPRVISLQKAFQKHKSVFLTYPIRNTITVVHCNIRCTIRSSIRVSSLHARDMSGVLFPKDRTRIEFNHFILEEMIWTQSAFLLHLG